MRKGLFVGTPITVLALALAAASQGAPMEPTWYEVGPLTQVYIRDADKVAILADISTLSRQRGTVTAMLYIYSGNDPIAPLEPMLSRFERERVQFDCRTLMRRTMKAERLDWASKQWRVKAYKYPGNLPHEPDDSPDRQIARFLCKVSGVSSGPSYSTLGHAIHSLESRFEQGDHKAKR